MTDDWSVTQFIGVESLLGLITRS